MGCWEDVYLRSMSELCSSLEDMNMGALCVVTHQTQNLEYAKLKVYGEEKRAVIHKPSHYEDMLQSVFEEGYCEHANGDNSDRNTTMAWTKERRPDAYDTVYSFLRGGSWMPSDGD